MQSAAFAAGLPALEEVRVRVSERSGLPVELEDGRLFFRCLPERPVTLSRIPENEAVRARMDATMRQSGFSGWVGPDYIHVKCALGQEPTLFVHACAALEDLGGVLVHPLLPDQKALLTGPLEEGFLLQRVRRFERRAKLLFWAASPLYLLWLPFFLVWLAGQFVVILFDLARLHWRMRRG